MEKDLRVTALLPMKGHSERVPDKNMRLFQGRPLYHQVADILERSELVSKILIDTDSQRIATDAKKNFEKVEIISRPPELQGDLVPMNDIIAHDLSMCQGEHLLQTHSTNPLLAISTLEKAIVEYFDHLHTFDSLFSVTKLQTRLYWESGNPVNHDPDVLLRTQDLKPLFEENSNIYIFSKTSFEKAQKKRVGQKPQMFVMNKVEALDIDDEEDFTLAEALFEVLKSSRG